MSATQEAPSRQVHFLHNIFWSWLGVLFSIVSGIFLSPYVIHRLGSERYGIWALVFSLVDYYALVDFGFRSSILKYASHYRAVGEHGRLEALVSTGLAYFSVAAAAVLAASAALAWKIDVIFKVPAGQEAAMRFLAITVGIGFALGVVFSSCTAVIEAHQRFDITSRIMIGNHGIRVTGCFLLLFLGFGLKAMGACVLTGQVTAYLLTYLALRRLLPRLRPSPRKADRGELRRMLRYGSRSFAANMSLNILSQSAPFLLGHLVSTTSAGYYIYPRRLLSVSVDLVDRLAAITGSKAAELTAYDDMGGIARMMALVNRYCLTLFLPISLYLTVFGRQLLEVWINPAFAANSAPLLPVLGAGITIATAASQHCSSALYGLAKHGFLAAGLATEAVLCVSGLWYAIPRYGILAAAAVVAGLMILSRGIYVPYVACRQLKVNFLRYIYTVYSRPLLIGAPVGLLAWLLNRQSGAHAGWTTVLGGGAAMLLCYYGLAALTLEPRHRRMILTAFAQFGGGRRIRGTAPHE